MVLHTSKSGVIWTPDELINWTPRTPTDDFTDECSKGNKMDDTDRPSLKLWTSKELLEIDFPPIKWTVPDLIPTGLTALVGSPKVGKSWLALGIASAASVGGAVLGRIEVPIQQVLMLALEDNPRRLQSRLESVGALGSEYLTIATEWERGEKACEWLSRYLDGHPETGIVIIDTWGRFAGPLDHNDYAVVTHAATTLKRIADDRDISIVMIHHSRKGGAEDWLESMLGSTGLAGAVDTTLLLRRGRGKREAELHCTGRDVEEQSFALTFDSDCGTWAIEGTLDEIQASDARQEIVNLLSQHPEGLTPKDAARDLEKNHNAVKKLLWTMANDGALISLSGRYTLSEPGNFGNPVTQSPQAPVTELPRLPLSQGPDAAQYLDLVASAGTIVGAS